MKSLTVAAPAGSLTGSVRNGVLRIHSVPYAVADPFGPSRPAPAADHDGRTPGEGELILTVTAPVDALADGSRTDDPLADASSTDEPLADGAPAANRPILLWIHGGRYEEGHPSEPWCSPRRFAEAGIVTVALGYRKKLEGFWRDPSESGEEVPYRAVDDMMIALQWVRDNAAAFGADPGNVTLSGQSAGAGLALAIASDPRSEGFVHRLIAMSPALSMRSGDLMRRTLGKVGARGPATAERLSAPGVADRAWALVRAVSPTDPAVGPRLGEFRPRVPTVVTATSREFHFVPMLAAADRMPGARALGRVTAWLHGAFGPLPPETGDRPVAAVISDASIRRNAVAVADRTSDAGLPTWVGEFRPGAGHGTGPDGVRTSDAPHCVDLPRYFGREKGHPFHRQMVNFITTGDPGGTGGAGGAGESRGAGESGGTGGPRQTSGPETADDLAWPRYEAPDRLGRIWSGGGTQATEAMEKDPWGGVRTMFWPKG